MRSGTTGTQMSVYLLLLPAQGIWFYACTASDVVSLSDTNLCQRL